MMMDDETRKILDTKTCYGLGGTCTKPVVHTLRRGDEELHECCLHWGVRLRNYHQEAQDIRIDNPALYLEMMRSIKIQGKELAKIKKRLECRKRRERATDGIDFEEGTEMTIRATKRRRRETQQETIKRLQRTQQQNLRLMAAMSPTKTTVSRINLLSAQAGGAQGDNGGQGGGDQGPGAADSDAMEYPLCNGTVNGVTTKMVGREGGPSPPKSHVIRTQQQADDDDDGDDDTMSEGSDDGSEELIHMSKKPAEDGYVPTDDDVRRLEEEFGLVHFGDDEPSPKRRK